MERGSGILMHIGELPSPYGIGTFGATARRFVRFLARAKQKYWQIRIKRLNSCFKRSKEHEDS